MSTTTTITQDNGTADAAQIIAHDPNTVILDEPIKRGDKEITAVTLRKPNAGALRGIKLIELLNIDVAALRVLLPRITTPTLVAQDVDALDPADITELGVRVADFFVRKSTRAEFQNA